jgi:hypothetical protein
LLDGWLAVSVDRTAPETPQAAVVRRKSRRFMVSFDV